MLTDRISRTLDKKFDARAIALDISKAFDKVWHKGTGKYTGAIYIDLSKAFDTISHASILNKLPNSEYQG